MIGYMITFMIYYVWLKIIYGSGMKTPQELVEQYGDMIYRIALSQTRRREDADDVFQEVFLALVRRSEPFTDETHEKAWLIRAALSLSKKQYTSAWHRHRASFHEEEGIPGITDIALTYEMDTEESEVYDAVSALPDKYRDAIHLFYYEEYSVKEIAAILEMKEGSVKSLLSRGRNMLREALAS